MITPFIIYTTHLTALSILGRTWNPRAPVMRLYVGLIVSTVGICSLAGYYFPTTFTDSLISIMQAYAVVDMLTYVEEPGYSMLQRIAIFYICRSLRSSPELYYLPAFGLYAVAPTYYAAAMCFPYLYAPPIYGLIHVIAGIGAPVYYLVNNPQMIYLFSLHITLLTNSVYEFGKWASGLRAV